MALEESGVPSVAVHTHVFARLARASALANGMPRTRQAFVPQPVVDRIARRAARLYRGQRSDLQAGRSCRRSSRADPVRSTDEDLKGVSFDRSTPRLLAPDSEDNLQRAVHREPLDGFPADRRSRPRSASPRCCKGTSRKPDEVVGRMRPTAFREFWEFTVEKVAVNAVMAGARPEYFPVILALAASGQTARSSSTTSMATIVCRQRPDPQRDRHECRHRRDGALQPRQRHDRPRLQSAVAKSARRLGAGRDPTWARSATGTPTAPASPRTKSAARGSRCTSKKASSRPTAPSASSSAALHAGGLWAARDLAREDSSAALRRPSTTTRRSSYSTRSPRASSSSSASIPSRS